MSIIRRRAWMLGLILGAGSASAQDLPKALPPLPDETARVSALPDSMNRSASVATALPPPSLSPVVRPMPPVVQVPPEGAGPVWAPNPLDPVALEKRWPPKNVERKARSWRWRRLQGKIWGYPEEYEPRPLGASLYDHGKIMVSNAAAARLVLYQYDFVDGTSELNPRGLDQLAKFIPQLAGSPFPLIVERTPLEPVLAEKRRYAVLATMARGPLPLASERVLVGVPAAVGMSGIDAQIIGSNALTRTGQYGPPIPLQSSGVNSPSGSTGSGGNGP